MNTNNSTARKPQFFMLGAPKCGTTALASYLSTHPSIRVAQPKEPHYFCKDLQAGGVPVHSDNEYLATFFPGFGESQEQVGLDTSVWYLYSEVAVDEILRFQPNARFLLMLRNPVDMANSLHSMFHFQGQEQNSDFFRAWKLQGGMYSQQSRPPRRWIDDKCLLYKDVCSLGSQLRRLFHQVDPARVHVELLDDMGKDPCGVYQRVLKFMGTPDDGRIQFNSVNAGRKLNNRLLVRALRSSTALHTAHVIKQLTGLKTLGVRRPDLSMRPAVRNCLNEALRDEILLLDSLLKRNLAERWLSA